MWDKIKIALTAITARLDSLESAAPKDGARGTDGKDGSHGRDGRDGKDGHDGSHGRDGITPDYDAIVRDVLAATPIPKNGADGRDGTDAEPVDYTRIVAEVAARIPAPKNGKDAPAVDVPAIVNAAVKQIKTPAAGKNGASITRVELIKNKLFVWIDNEKTLAGKLELPQISRGVFTPGTSGGGGSSSHRGVKAVIRVDVGDFGTTATQTPTGLGDAGKITVNYGAGGTTADGHFTLNPDGTLIDNVGGVEHKFAATLRVDRTGGGGVSLIVGRFMYAPDGNPANGAQVSDSFSVKIDDADTTWREVFEGEFTSAKGGLLWFEIARDESGSNSGQIAARQPTGTLGAWNPVNSASLSITRRETA